MISYLLPLALLQAASAEEAATAAPPAPPPPTCASEAHAAFDFWVGEWEVYAAASDTFVGESRIERVSAGCVIRETWMPTRGGHGTSMSFINHNTGLWEQVWVGSDGTRVDFTGGIVSSEEVSTMVLTGYWDGIGPDRSPALIRMTYSRLEQGAVRQFGELSTDHGKVWQDAFNFVYRPKEDASE